MSLHQTVLDPDSVSETLKCPVCMEVFDEPVFCGGRPCQHVFCRGCVERALERTEQCPVCREPMLAEDLHPHQVIRSLLDEVTVICERECGWTGRRDAWSAHIAVCPVVLMEEARENLEAQSRRFEGVDSQLTEKDARIAELEALVAEKDRLVISTGQEVLKRQLQISELENSYRKANLQLCNCRQQLADRNSELERLHGERVESHGGAYVEGMWRDSVSPQAARHPYAAAPPPTPLGHKTVPDRDLEAAAVDLDLGLSGVEIAGEDSWLDPAGFSQMNLPTYDEEAGSSISVCNLDDTAGDVCL